MPNGGHSYSKETMKMAQYAKMHPVTMTFTVTIDGVTPGGKCRAVIGSETLVAAAGPDAEHFRPVVTKWGDILLIDGRLARKPEPKVAPAPAPAPVKGKSKGKAAPVAAPAPAPAAAPDMAAIVAAVMAALGQK
jgi:hypothetical protein